ncbi:4-alpha-glucanotransferase [Pseudoalteromonas phenolica]|uniref:4-alpha-glucanotransferase n=1 Tax=Pseudoalteromonas phenolica TaxID=161398 RepID=A0A5R9Q517_9GAMM|nr:4-alpha-glucanotransferase [Pseudoalteromonas phenolica]TLX48248.1 4-alpha-glucanotransferase [Pseudoalteromonas phenolica]
MNAFEQLCYLYGIGSEFTKYTGETVRFSQQVREAALKACDIDFYSNKSIHALNYKLDVAPWHSLLPSISLVEQSEPHLTIRIKDNQKYGPLYLEVSEIDLSVELSFKKAVFSGEYIDADNRFVELKLPISKHLPTGYFTAQVTLDDEVYFTELWVTPKEAVAFNEQKQFGVSVQLYTLTSAENYGFGDFSDLQQLINSSAKSGIDFILLNPLHLLFEEQPQRASPYSPSHRGLINPLYISIAECLTQTTFVQMADEHNSALAILNAEKQAQYIDYELVAETKYKLLKSLYRQFKQNASLKLQRNFRRFCQTKSNLLSTFADDERAKFWQWLAHEQLNKCQKLCLSLGMKTGLVNDLAVGCAKDGLEFLANQSIFSKYAEIGAPPDPWAENGQNWGLPVIDPKKMTDNNFAYFKQLIKENMQYFGALRIDHVMSLRRLWWCLTVDEEQNGCYVYYPFEYLLAILKIESHLNNTGLVGEDLGVVPPEVTEALAISGIYGNTLFYFEKNHLGEFKHGNDYRENCMLMLSNHDVPPFISWWYAHDVDLKLSLSLCNELEANELKSQRLIDKQRVLNWLNKSHLKLESDVDELFNELVKTLIQTPPKLFSLNFDDLAKQTLPINIPGTDKEYKNWRRRILTPIEDVFAVQQSLLNDLTALRKSND